MKRHITHGRPFWLKANNLAILVPPTLFRKLRKQGLGDIRIGFQFLPENMLHELIEPNRSPCSGILGNLRFGTRGYTND